ncbi:MULTISPECIES: AAA family ATPase [unclassified Bradyrhizobium]|uniref:AAA family ATPase n=1 Tax=unclassified Bradyrhizobium TaxID=2631580 RepID=UPI00247B25CD|nr:MULTISPECIES: AAA family ATPase [unclassified Bradyrhizobium]WGR69718.1 AAA family ATPase [Bradyrhizobium sp. ISRA426]WGR81774.1 AAA family ATPase [Bradyrhizobium sp. ISRA430]WGR84960.1 AAA family ATPase [Bradyrhizobium sp. ISRA432]
MRTDALAFGEFRLDRANALLWRGRERIALAPKPFEVLCCLVGRPGELVTKEELLDSVWSDLHVSESSLAVAMNALRSALGDDRQSPNYIETVTRRGYRFIAAVTTAERVAVEQVVEEGASAAEQIVDRRRQWRVGRAAALETLDKALQLARTGQRQVVFITGEAGIGKTTLVQMTLDRIERQGLGVLHCNCNELFGTHEAFLPLIEALNERCRGTEGASLLASIRDHAPTWLAQMPGFLGEADRAAFQHEVFGATRERMLREFADLMESLAAVRPWVIILEDLHWSDFATVDVLSRLARRDRKAAILVLATYRPMEVAVGGHPVRAVHQDLRIHGHAAELALDRLTGVDVERYLALRFNSTDFARDLVERIFARTGGQPLFVTSLVDHLVAQGALVEDDAGWRLVREEAALHDSMPRDLEGMITQQIDHLTAEERSLLEVASAAGAEFSALQVSGVLDRPVLEVEQMCEDLARAGRIIVVDGITEWPNGEVSGRYAFQHALYQETLYQRLAPARRTKTHASLGAGLERGYGPQAREIAAVLARHFELGRDFPKAMQYLGMAAEGSARRFSTREAANYLSRALELVPHLPPEFQVATRLKLLLQRAWAWRAGGDFLNSLQDLGAVVAHAAENGLVREEVNALVDLSRFCLYVDRRQSLPFAEQALAKSRAIDDAAFGALVQGNFANLKLMLRGWDRENAELSERASRLITDSQDLSMRLRRCSMEMVLEFLRSNYPACCEATTRGKELARLLGDVYLFALYESVEAFAQIYLGEWGRMQRSVAATLTISERNANPQAIALCQLTIGWLHSEAEEYGSAARRGEEALGPMIEANPFTFFVGRNLLARAHVRMRNLAVARQHLDALERRMEVDHVPMESLVIPQYLLTCCDYWIAIGDLDRAQSWASQLHAVTSAAPDRPFLVLSHDAMARIALLKHDTQTARDHLSAAISIVRRGRLPNAAWRAYRTSAVLYESLGHAQKAAKWQDRAGRVIASLAQSLDPGDPLLSAALFDASRDVGTKTTGRT